MAYSLNRAQQDEYQKQLGSRGEDLAAAYLASHGYTVIATNVSYRCGELDIIATRDHILAFVEVKTRAKALFPIANVVTYPKQLRMSKAAAFYTLEHKLFKFVRRFDIITIELTTGTIKHIPNSFYAHTK